MPRRLAVALVAALGAALCAAACAPVRPWQREVLASRAMVGDEDAGEARFNQHARGSREGADGGTGRPGGGCGCN